MRVIGTAGHVDHGKSTLVQALTGTHPDRLKEEREREMTIDLGFAWMKLPNGEEIGIVDVPGHRDFIENMLAGVGGIDAALFVVAADEGVMPQTREHLAILDLLHVQGGVVALTKTDNVDDPEWLDLVEEDLRLVLSGTVLSDAPIVRVSGRTGDGIPQLLEALIGSLSNRPSRPDLGRPRLPIDRVFTVAGFGTVVTGTLLDGHFKIGDEVEILPRSLSGRIRGLQTHKQTSEFAVPGSRTAINISGINADQIERGEVVVHPGDYLPTRRIDVQFRLLPDVSQPIQHNVEVKLFIGASETIARLRLLGVEELMPGQEGWLQLEPKTEITTVRGDRYILRRPSPGETLGGGIVLDAHPKRRYKRFSDRLITRLEALAGGSPVDLVFQALVSLEAAPLEDVIAQANLDPGTAADAVSQLVRREQIIPLGVTGQNLSPDVIVASRSYWERIVTRADQVVEKYHRRNPLKRGMPREELKSRLNVSPRVFSAVLRKVLDSQMLVDDGPYVRKPNHEIRFNEAQSEAIRLLIDRFALSPYAPPSVKDAREVVSEDVYEALVDLGKLIQVSPDVVFRREDYDNLIDEVQNYLINNQRATAAEIRDHFDTSRKYALALLEHMDSIGITIREGDFRRLKINR